VRQIEIDKARVKDKRRDIHTAQRGGDRERNRGRDNKTDTERQSNVYSGGEGVDQGTSILKLSDIVIGW